jgi:hypothetical protein
VFGLKSESLSSSLSKPSEYKLKRNGFKLNVVYGLAMRVRRGREYIRFKERRTRSCMSISARARTDQVHQFCPYYVKYKYLCVNSGQFPVSSSAWGTYILI